MRLLFIVDPLYRLNPRTDSTVALMRSACRSGHEVYAATLRDFSWQGDGVYFRAQHLSISWNEESWQQGRDVVRQRSDFFHLLLMRKEPPVDEAFVMATRFLEQASAMVPVFNAPATLRSLNEKLAIFLFPTYSPPTWVGADANEATAFYRDHESVVLKPLDGMGGQGVYRAYPEDVNFRAVFTLLSEEGSKAVMVQQYLPDARQGDYRVFVVDGLPLPQALRRIPPPGDHRSNFSIGGTVTLVPLPDAARTVALVVGEKMKAMGVLFAALDIIGDRILEINITCPSGLRLASDHSGEDMAAPVLKALLAHVN